MNLTSSYIINGNSLAIGASGMWSSMLPIMHTVISADPERIVVEQLVNKKTHRIVWLPYVPEGDTQE